MEDICLVYLFGMFLGADRVLWSTELSFRLVCPDILSHVPQHHLKVMSTHGTARWPLLYVNPRMWLSCSFDHPPPVMNRAAVHDSDASPSHVRLCCAVDVLGFSVGLLRRSLHKNGQELHAPRTSARPRPLGSKMLQLARVCWMPGKLVAANHCLPSTTVELDVP